MGEFPALLKSIASSSTIWCRNNWDLFQRIGIVIRSESGNPCTHLYDLLVLDSVLWTQVDFFEKRSDQKSNDMVPSSHWSLLLSCAWRVARMKLQTGSSYEAVACRTHAATGSSYEAVAFRTHEATGSSYKAVVYCTHEATGSSY